VTEEPTIETLGSGNCSCGYPLANKCHDTRAIQAWLGHRPITSTAAALAPNRFKDFCGTDATIAR
jgi:hypothetical protein